MNGVIRGSRRAPGKPVDGGGYAEALEDFASELTKLRHKKNLTIAALANRSGVSRTSVTTALGGKELPSARNVIAIAAACEVDEAPLVTRRNQIARMNDAPASRLKKPRSGAVPWWWIPITAVFCTLVASASVLALVDGIGAPHPAATVSVATGQDPANTKCLDDAAVAAAQTTDKLYLLEIIYSDKCHAGWARLTRYDGAATGNTITVRIYPRESPNGADVQTATEHDVQSAYTTLLVRPTPKTLLCAQGSASVNGQQIMTESLCT